MSQEPGIETEKPQSRVRSNRTEGTQTLSTEQIDAQIKAIVATEKQHRETERHHHQLTEEQKDNELRRLALKVLMGVVVLCLITSFVVAIKTQNDTTRLWAQGIVTLILGGIVGGVTGYFGRGGK